MLALTQKIGHYSTISCDKSIKLNFSNNPDSQKQLITKTDMLA